jgi:nucleotide-binding universal stress UspA family protein
MYKKIMIPLDGSPLAECVLPHVESIAKGCDAAEVVFVRVVEPIHLPAGGGSDGGYIFSEKEAARIHKETESQNKSLAEKYLDGLIRQRNYAGVKMTAEVLEGNPAHTLAEYAEKNQFDLLVIATHGRSGVSRWVWGSVADRILRSACVPVLMVRAPGCVPGI